MTYEKMIESVRLGNELKFAYHGEIYWICQTKNEIYLTRARDSYYLTFINVEELSVYAKIDDIALSVLWHNVDIQSSAFPF